LPTIEVAAMNTKKFRATIEKAGGVGSWSRIILPFGVPESWGAEDASQLQHDPEKWVPVFGKDHAPTIR
jgi:hypothetical protein